MIGRLLRAPGVHFVVGGALLFAAVSVWGPGDRSGDSGQVVVATWRFDQEYEAFVAGHHRAPTADELAGIVRALVDEELLLRHALALGLDRQEPVERRLAQIASFVAADGDVGASAAGDPSADDELSAHAEEAKRLGLHTRDAVVRRILVESAGRLIRSAVLTREPSEDALHDFLAQHSERFELPEEIELEWQGEGDTTTETWPPLRRSDLERRLGRDFAEALDATRVGEWQGPLPSRNGPLRVRVVGHRPERHPALEEVRDEVRSEVTEMLADRWLAARLEQLRAEAEIVLPTGRELPAPIELWPAPTGRTDDERTPS